MGGYKMGCSISLFPHLHLHVRFSSSTTSTYVVYMLTRLPAVSTELPSERSSRQFSNLAARGTFFKTRCFLAVT